MSSFPGLLLISRRGGALDKLDINQKETSRRTVLGKFLILIIGSSVFSLSRLSAADESQNVHIEWRIPRENLVEAKEQLNFNGAVYPDLSTVTDGRGLPLIYILLGIVASKSLAEAIIEIRRSLKYGGTVVDVRKDRVRIEHDPALDPKVLVVVTNDDSKVFRRDDVLNAHDLSEVLLSGHIK